MHAKIKAKDSASRSANRVGATVHAGVADPLRGVDSELGFIARRSAAGAGAPRLGVQERGRLCGQDMIALVMRVVDGTQPRQGLALLAGAHKVVQHKSAQRRWGVGDAGGVRGPVNEGHSRPSRRLDRVRGLAEGFRDRTAFRILLQPFLRIAEAEQVLEDKLGRGRLETGEFLGGAERVVVGVGRNRAGRSSRSTLVIARYRKDGNPRGWLSTDQGPQSAPEGLQGPTERGDRA